MAQLKSLIVNGSSRFIGDVFANTFTGNLSGNATTATSATSASTAAALTGYTIKSMTAAGSLGWTGNTADAKILITNNVVAYWNGAYNSNNASNLTYCAAGTIIGSNTIGNQSVKYATYLGSASGSYDFSTLDTILTSKAEKNHTHLYAGSSSAGGAATSANKLNTNAGSSTLPVYFSNGVPVAISSTGVAISITGNAKTADSASSAGNADTVDSLHVHTGRNNEANKIVRTDANGYIQCGYINSSSGDEGNNASPTKVWGTNGSDSYMRTYLTSALSVNKANYATYLGDANNNYSYDQLSLSLSNILSSNTSEVVLSNKMAEFNMIIGDLNSWKNDITSTTVNVSRLNVTESINIGGTVLRNVRFLTQSAYTALTTKDPYTIYFIKEG